MIRSTIISLIMLLIKSRGLNTIVNLIKEVGDTIDPIIDLTQLIDELVLNIRLAWFYGRQSAMYLSIVILSKSKDFRNQQ